MKITEIDSLYLSKIRNMLEPLLDSKISLDDVMKEIETYATECWEAGLRLDR